MWLSSMDALKYCQFSSLFRSYLRLSFRFRGSALVPLLQKKGRLEYKERIIIA